MADEQEALLAQIRALSGAIDERRSNGTAQHSVSRGRGRGAYRGAGGSTYRGSSRGSWRGGGHGAPLPSRHRSLVISGNNTGQTAAAAAAAASSSSSGSHDATTTDTGRDASSATAGTNGQDGWVKRKSTHNMSLVSSSTFEKTEPARLAAIAATHSAKQASKSAAAPSKLQKAKGKSSASVRRGDNMGEVIIDGVTFEFDETGTKLVKKVASAASEETDPTGTGDQKATDATATDGATSPTPSTPLRTSVNGQQFVRTKTGNLISQTLLNQRRENKRNSEKLKRLEKIGKEIAGRQVLRNAGRGGGRGGARATGVARKKILCAYFNKTGQCKNGLSCPYKHDMARVAICPRFLRSNGCPLPDGTCPLSHDAKHERVPHCVHYLATAGACRNGDACTYTHPASGVDVNNASPICMDFSDFGWCSKGRTCTQRHTWDCPEFLRRGKCDRRGCKLMHVVRVPASEVGDKDVKGAQQLNDEELFIRDDDAQVKEQNETLEEEDLTTATASEQRQNKRKRGVRIHDTQQDSDEQHSDASEEAEAPEEELLRFKTRKSKAFSGQNDFISFNDMDDEESDEEEEDDNVDAEQSEGNASDDNEQVEDDEEASSVHSDSSSEDASEQE